MRAVAAGPALLAAALLAGGCASPFAGAGSRAPTSPVATRDPSSPYATTRAEFFLAMKVCMEERGFLVTVDVAYGAIYTHETTDQRAREATAALNECGASIDSRRQQPPPKATEAELRLWYGYVLAQLRCLQAAGYTTPEAPPEQVFIDSGGYWDPTAKTQEASGRTVSINDQRRCEQIQERPAFMDW